MKQIAIFLFALRAASAQPQQSNFSAPPPAPISSVSVSLIGNPGNATYCYYVVAIYPRGKSFPTGPACIFNAPSTLTGSNYVAVSWTASAGATAYDVIRTASGIFPAAGTCAACAVVTAQTGVTLNDQGGALSAYTLTIATSAVGNLTFNNRDYASPRLVSDTPIQVPTLAFADGTSQTTAGGGGSTYTPGAGIAIVGTVISTDNAVIPTKAIFNTPQNPQICTSASASGAAYTASCAQPLSSYAAKQTVFWYADVANTIPAPTGNFDTLGGKTMVKQDGTALAVGDIKAGALYRVWYDGTNIRVVEAGLGGASAAPLFGSGYGEWVPWPGHFASNNALAIGPSPAMYEFTIFSPGAAVGKIYIKQFAGGGTNFWSLALYNQARTVLLANSAGVASAAGAVIPIPITNTLAAGTYNLALSANASTSVFLMEGSWGEYYNGDAANPRFVSCSNAVNWTTPATPVWPATCGTPTSLGITNTANPPYTLFVK